MWSKRCALSGVLTYRKEYQIVLTLSPRNYYEVSLSCNGVFELKGDESGQTVEVFVRCQQLKLMVKYGFDDEPITEVLNRDPFAFCLERQSNQLLKASLSIVAFF